MKILTIIVSYNFCRWIVPCLQSLSLSLHPTDVLIVDNGSGDDTVDVLRREYPSVRVIENEENLGFGRANNIGMRIAIEEGYEAVLLLNQDAWVAPETIGTLSELSVRYPAFGIFSPTHLDGTGARLDKGFAQYTHIDGKTSLPLSVELVEAEFINAAFWFIPLRTIEAVGGFSPLFHHYGEDKDYANRLHYHGLKIGYSPHVLGYHDRGGRKVTREAFLRSEYVYLLSEYVNINRTWAGAFAHSILAGVKKAFIALVHGKPEDALAYFCLSAKLMAKSRCVVHTRHITRQKRTNFI